MLEFIKEKTQVLSESEKKKLKGGATEAKQVIITDVSEGSL